jgi:hypothetical protein
LATAPPTAPTLPPSETSCGRSFSRVVALWKHHHHPLPLSETSCMRSFSSVVALGNTTPSTFENEPTAIAAATPTEGHQRNAARRYPPPRCAVLYVLNAAVPVWRVGGHSYHFSGNHTVGYRGIIPLKPLSTLTLAYGYPYPSPGVRVLTGTGEGREKKPGGYPGHTLGTGQGQCQ